MEATDETFQNDVLESNGKVLVEFWASWCPPCKMMAPLIDRLRSEYADKVPIVGVNIDRSFQTAATFNVQVAPSFVLFNCGTEVTRAAGAQTEKQLRALLDHEVSAPTAEEPCPEDTVGIVSGLPRSGTSMMMRMLETGGLPVLCDNVRAADHDNPNGYYEFEPVKTTAENPDWVPRGKGKIVKMVYRLLYDLPPGFHYRVVFMRRDMQEILASQRRMLKRSGKSVDPGSDARMARMFERDLRRFEHWLAKQPNFDVVQINYNEMLSAPTLPLQRLNTFFGGRLDVDAMQSAIDPSLYRQRVA